MSNALQTAHILLDIEPPVVPADTGLAAALAGIAVIIVVMMLVTIAIRHFTSYRSQARRRLRHLQKSVNGERDSNGSSDSNAVYDKEIAYQLAQLLAMGVGINGITSSTALPVELAHHHDRWQHFTNKLSTARYGSQSCHSSSLDELFRESLFWLKNWP